MAAPNQLIIYVSLAQFQNHEYCEYSYLYGTEAGLRIQSTCLERPLKDWKICGLSGALQWKILFWGSDRAISSLSTAEPPAYAYPLCI